MVRGVARDLRQGVAAAIISARFHETMARAVVLGCSRTREALGLTLVALSGGCFQNRRLTERARELLAARGFEVLLHRRVPPNDGGVAFGQAAVASFQLARASHGATPSCA
jgi:hydrogenase maturation protein HypF